MMKQFLRVKQIADQKFQRVERSGVLSNELNAAEKRVDLIRESCSAAGKKLSACAQRIALDPSARGAQAKRVPESSLAQCMEEWGLSLGEHSILGLTLVDSARVQETLANDLLSYKMQMEESVVEPLQNILNVDVGNILKYRKQLFKLSSEMDSAKTRYQSAVRSSMGSQSTPAVASKVQLLKEETEDMVSRVDQCRDSLTGEMLNLISREPEMAQVFVRLCQLQLDYHRKAFYTLESALPELEAQIKSCAYQQVFGTSLNDHLKVTKREIATVIETCVCWLLESAMEEEGLFRIGGSMIKIKKMKSAFDAGFHYLIEDEKDPHNVAGVLKLYLRSLPNPLLTYELYDQWMEAAMVSDHDSRMQALWQVVNSLPETHFDNLRYLIKFLAKLCQSSDTNKMSVQNVAIVIGPNLLWPPVEDSILGMNMTATNLHSSIVDTLITYADWFFPGECEFRVSTPTSPRHLVELSANPLYGSQVSLSTHKLSNGDSALESMSSSPTNSPTSPSPRVPSRPRKKAAPRAPASPITRSVSCSGFQAAALAQASRMLSASHENLVNGEKSEARTESAPPAPDRNNVQMRPSRPKPPRHSSSRMGLPPVAERQRVERPSVPPPERPKGPPPTPVVDPEDVTLCFDSNSSTGSEGYGECQGSFADDSDGDPLPLPARVEKTVTFSSREQLIFEREGSGRITPEVVEIEVSNKDLWSAEPTETVPLDEEDSPYECHFHGGTPTWFDHYGDDKRQSASTLWFNEGGPPLTTVREENSPATNATTDDLPQFRKPGIAIKIRVNSETQDTRL